VEISVLEIASLDLGSGLKTGLSGILCFAGNESRHVDSRCTFPAADVLVNPLIEEPIKGSATLFTGHLSRLVSGFERRLLHRSVAHYHSTHVYTRVSSKIFFSDPIALPYSHDYIPRFLPGLDIPVGFDNLFQWIASIYYRPDLPSLSKLFEED